jgi:hypothetical protein
MFGLSVATPAAALAASKKNKKPLIIIQNPLYLICDVAIGSSKGRQIKFYLGICICIFEDVCSLY